MTCLKIYRVGVCFITGLIGTGNLVTTVHCALADPDWICVPMAGLSVVKGVTYGAIWPIFVPYACGKALRKPYYIGSKFGKINANGFAPHIIPGWRITTKDLLV